VAGVSRIWARDSGAASAQARIRHGADAWHMQAAPIIDMVDDTMRLEVMAPV